MDAPLSNVTLVSVSFEIVCWIREGGASEHVLEPFTLSRRRFYLSLSCIDIPSFFRHCRILVGRRRARRRRSFQSMQMTLGKNVTLFGSPASVQQRDSRQRPSLAMYSERRTAPFSSLKLLARQHVTSPLRNVCFEGTMGTTFSFPERISPMHVSPLEAQCSPAPHSEVHVFTAQQQWNANSRGEMPNPHRSGRVCVFALCSIHT